LQHCLNILNTRQCTGTPAGIAVASVSSPNREPELVIMAEGSSWSKVLGSPSSTDSVPGILSSLEVRRKQVIQRVVPVPLMLCWSSLCIVCAGHSCLRKLVGSLRPTGQSVPYVDTCNSAAPHVCACVQLTASISSAAVPFDATFILGRPQGKAPGILFLHGGPHSAYATSYLHSLAFLASLGYNIVVPNYRYQCSI
jgi:hypothetical protein